MREEATFHSEISNDKVWGYQNVAGKRRRGEMRLEAWALRKKSFRVQFTHKYTCGMLNPPTWIWVEHMRNSINWRLDVRLHICDQGPGKWRQIWGFWTRRKPMVATSVANKRNIGFNWNLRNSFAYVGRKLHTYRNNQASWTEPWCGYSHTYAVESRYNIIYCKFVLSERGLRSLGVELNSAMCLSPGGSTAWDPDSATILRHVTDSTDHVAFDLFAAGMQRVRWAVLNS